MTSEQPIYSQDLQGSSETLNTAVTELRALVDPAALVELDTIQRFAEYAKDSDAVESKCVALFAPAKEAVTRLNAILKSNKVRATAGWAQTLSTINQAIDEITVLLGL